MSKGNFDLVRLLWQRKVRRTREMQKVSGVPPLQYSAKKQGTLKNYRIYGQTVDGESVGDRTGNLFNKNTITSGYGITKTDGTLEKNSSLTATDFIPVEANTNYTNNASFHSTGFYGIAFYDSTKTFISGMDSGEVSSNATPYTYQTPANAAYMRVSLYTGSTSANKVNINTYRINKGSTSLPYEPYGYKVPVTVSNDTDTLTTSIYLPKQIRKVGVEAEYIDYAEQKMHRIGADDIDVTLPALPVLPGTNVLSVGTAVQPSNIEIKGKIKDL